MADEFFMVGLRREKDRGHYVAEIQGNGFSGNYHIRTNCELKLDSWGLDIIDPTTSQPPEDDESFSLTVRGVMPKDRAHERGIERGIREYAVCKADVLKIEND